MGRKGGGVIKQDQTPFQFHTQLYYTCISITHINYTDKALHHVNKYSRSSIQKISLHVIVSFEAKIHERINSAYIVRHQEKSDPFLLAGPNTLNFSLLICKNIYRQYSQSTNKRAKLYSFRSIKMVLLQKHVGINKSILNKYYSNWLKFPSKKLKKHKLNGA